MNNAQLVQVLDARDYLLEKLASFTFFEALVLDDVVEELTSRNVLGNQVKLPGSFNVFIQLDDVGVPDGLQYLDLSRHSFDVDILHNFMFFKDLNCHFFSSKVVLSYFDFTKGTFSYGLSKFIMADVLWLPIFLFATFTWFFGMVSIFAGRG